MALHWDEFEARVRADINRPDVGRLPQASLARWANEGQKAILRRTQLPKGRIVIEFQMGAVTLVEEDWPGTEEVGIPAYTYGFDGAFYIRCGFKIDALHEVRNTGDDCNPCWEALYEIREKKRQEHIYGPPLQQGTYPTYYGVYRYYVHVERDCPEPPRPASEPYEVLGVWLDPMFEYDCDDVGRYLQIQYRRWGPDINLTLLNEGCPDEEYTQPYFYFLEEYEDLLIAYAKTKALFALGDNRYTLAAAELNSNLRVAKWNSADRGDVDDLWRIQPVDSITRITGVDL